MELENIRLKEQLISERLKVKFLTYLLETKLQVPVSKILNIDEEGVLGLSQTVKDIKFDCDVDVEMDEEEKTTSTSSFKEEEGGEAELNKMVDALSKSGTVMSKTCFQIRQLVEKKCDTMNIKTYTQFCQDNYDKVLRNLSQRTFPKKKINELIENSFPILSLRLIGKNEYDFTADDVTNLRKLLSNTTRSCATKYTVFNMDCTRLHNICVSILSIQECIERLFFNNPSKKHNLIYLQNKKQFSSDPYTFYQLAFIECDGTRQWRLDNRLVNTTNMFIENMLPHCVVTFKNLYFDIFHDNVYRVNYEEKSSIAQVECKQLMKTILILLHSKEVRKIFMSIVIKNSTIDAPTMKDRLDMTSDDKLFVQDLLQQENVDANQVESTFNQMFDTISRVDIENIMKTFSISISTF